MTLVYKPVFTNSRMRKMIIVIVIVLCLNSFSCQPRLEAFVAQGVFSKIIDFSYSACLGISQPGENEMENLRVSWMCGSSILNQRLLLTAAHCVYKCHKSASILVQYGDENREKAMIMMVLRYLNHPEYSEVELTRYDIALVMVKKPLNLTETVGRVVLLQNPPYNEMGLIAGWGYIDVSIYTFYVRLKLCVSYKVIPLVCRVVG